MILYNDEVAGSYMDFLKDRGLRVPEDISLVSFDDAGPVQEGDLTILSVIHPKYNLAADSAQSSADDRGFGLAGKKYSLPVSGDV